MKISLIVTKSFVKPEKITPNDVIVKSAGLSQHELVDFTFLATLVALLEGVW